MEFTRQTNSGRPVPQQKSLSSQYMGKESLSKRAWKLEHMQTHRGPSCRAANRADRDAWLRIPLGKNAAQLGKSLVQKDREIILLAVSDCPFTWPSLRV